jgi:hypothetical protein
MTTAITIACVGERWWASDSAGVAQIRPVQAYEVTTSWPGSEHTALRRFGDFVALHEALMKTDPNLVKFISLPSKVFGTSPEARRPRLEAMLSSILSGVTHGNHSFHARHAIDEFLSIDKRKKTEKALPHHWLASDASATAASGGVREGTVMQFSVSPVRLGTMQAGSVSHCRTTSDTRALPSTPPLPRGPTERLFGQSAGPPVAAVGSRGGTKSFEHSDANTHM